MILKSKTSCFTIVQIALTTVKDGFFDYKTSCFVKSDGSDTFTKSITLPNL